MSKAKNEQIKCACGCGQALWRFHPKFGIERRYIHGHNVVSKRVESICPTCKKSFTVAAYTYQEGKPNYCSRECWGKFKRSQVQVTCLHCQSVFEVPLYRTRAAYCSKQCRLAHESITRPCAYCGVSVTRGRAHAKQERLYCSRECQHLYQSEHCRRENHPLWKNAPKRDMGHNWSRQRRAALNRDNHMCQQCGQTHHLDVHHIIPGRCFTIPEASNHLANLVTLCEHCHPGADAKARRQYPAGYIYL